MSEARCSVLVVLVDGGKAQRMAEELDLHTLTPSLRIKYR
jgi:hypothetical protein